MWSAASHIFLQHCGGLIDVGNDVSPLKDKTKITVIFNSIFHASSFASSYEIIVIII